MPRPRKIPQGPLVDHGAEPDCHLGRYRDSEGANFRLGAFHDKLISYGSLPLSVVEWLMFDDEGSVHSLSLR